MLNEKIIKALEAKGFKRWTKGNMDRLYIDAKTALDFEYDTNKSGHVSGAWLNGEKISNTRGSELVSSKTYIDVNTGALVSNNNTMRDAAQEIMDATAAEIEQAEAAETVETENGYEAMSDNDLMMEEYRVKAILTHKNSEFYGAGRNVSAEEREAALEELRKIRLAKWARPWGGKPGADERDQLIEELNDARDRLEAAEASGYLHKIYMLRNRIAECEDGLAAIG